MRKIVYIFVFVFVSLFSFLQVGNTFGVEETIISEKINQVKKIDYILFHLETCPHCREEIKFLNNKLLPKYGEYINFEMYEVSDSKNQEIFAQYGTYYGVPTQGVPTAFIGGEVVSGYSSDSTTGKQITELVERKFTEKNILIDIQNQKTATTDGSDTFEIPLLGTVDARSISLPFLTIVLGLFDGFNPCAMWALLFLISLLLGMKDKRKMWLLGSIFIVSSGAVYFIFMAAWLQFLLFIGMIVAIRIMIGLIAIGVGSYQLKGWWRHRKTEGVVCEVSSKKTTQNTFEKIKQIVHKENLFLSIVGIIILGFSVNLVELACSAGFPAIFTQVLALNDIEMWKRYLYMVGYIFFYMLDDMVVFVLTMLTLKSKTIGGKYVKYANLVGGALILILGMLLIFKPEWLMFG
ncbi:MAG: hypothetical protein HYV41_00295 [Candidatus Magasanikbacteria bacterium]|nr:hypothetical protein [Candidatus Magasanikbacteria bacterium]